MINLILFLLKKSISILEWIIIIYIGLIVIEYVGLFDLRSVILSIVRKGIG